MSAAAAAAAAAAGPMAKRARDTLRVARVQEEEELWFSVPAPKNRWLALPREIWVIILALITSARDFNAIRATCKTLRRAAGQRWFGHLSEAFFIPLEHDIRACCTWSGALVTGHTGDRICIWGDEFAGFAPTNSSNNRAMGYRREAVREMVIVDDEGTVSEITAMTEWNGMLALAIATNGGDFGVIQVRQQDGELVYRAGVPSVVNWLVVWDDYLVSVGGYGRVYIFELGAEIHNFQISPNFIRCAVVFHGYFVISSDFYVYIYANPGCTLVHTLTKHERSPSAPIVWGDLLAFTDFGTTRSPTVILRDMNYEKVGEIELGYCLTTIALADFWGFLWAVNTLRGVAEIYGPGLELMGHGKLPFATNCHFPASGYCAMTTFKDFVVFGAGIQLHLYRKRLSPPRVSFPF